MKTISGIFFLLSVSSICFSVPLPPDIDTLSPAEFTAEYIKTLKNKKQSIVAEAIGDLHVRAIIAGKTYNTFLDNAYKEYAATMKDLSKILARNVKTALAIYSAGITVDINRIVPVIKTRGYLKDSANIAIDSSLDTNNLPVVYDNYNDQLIVLYGQDVGTHISNFGTMELNKACINRNELREIAVNNLTQMLPRIKTLDDNGTYMVQAGGCYEASLILCRKFWNRMQFPVKGEIIIAIPSRDIVLVAGNRDKTGIKKIGTMAQKLHNESSYPLEPGLFVLDSAAGMFKKYNPVTENLVKKKTDVRPRGKGIKKSQ